MHRLKFYSKCKSTVALLVAIVILLQISPTAFATSEAATVLDGKVSITNSNESAVTNVTDSGVSISLIGEEWDEVENTVTVQNNSGSTAEISFDYIISNITEEDETSLASNSGTFQKTLEDKDSITISYKLSFNPNTVTLELSNFALAVIADSANVTVTYDDTLGSVTVNNETVADGGVIEGVGADGVTLTAVPNAGATFVGWVDENNTSLSAETTYTHYPTGDITLTAVFATAAAAPWFQVGTYTTQDLSDAITKAQSTNKTIILTSSGTLPANTTYNIPSGVKLLIPYNDACTENFNEKPGTSTETPGSSQYAYATLTLGTGTVINCAGQICVNGQVEGTSGSYTGVPTGPYGHIKLSSNSKINVNGGTLYCYGYITGDGDVIANSGTVYEVFQLLGWKGGSAAAAWYKASNIESFPINDYAVQNIEADFTVNSGATAKGIASITVGDDLRKQIAVEYIGTNAGLVQLGSGASVQRSFSAATNRMCYTLSGTAAIGSVNITIQFTGFEAIAAELALGTTKITMNSAESILAIPYYMDFVAESGSTVTLTNSYKLLPGASLTANGDVIVSGNLYIYDTADYVGKGYVSDNSIPVLYVASTGATSGLPVMNSSTPSGQVVVNGTLTVNGGLFVTENGGVVMTGSGTFVNNSTKTTDDIGLDEYTYSDGVVDHDIATTTVVTTTGPHRFAHDLWHQGDVVPTVVTGETVAPTCTEQGYTTGGCSVCGEIKYNLIDALGHTHEDGNHTCTVCNVDTGHIGSMIAGRAATCVTDGWQDYYDCDICDMVFSDADYTIEYENLEKWKTGDGKIDAIGHTLVNGVCSVCSAPSTQQLPENIIGCTNLYKVLTPKEGYYNAEEYTFNNQVISVVIPVEPGDRIAANSFGSVSENMGTVNGIRVTYLQNGKIVSSLGPDVIYREYMNRGYITVPEGVDTVCVPWWQLSESNWLNLRQGSKGYAVHNYTDGVCTVCGEEKSVSPYLQQLPEDTIGCTNLYEELTPKEGYYNATEYLASYDQVVSVVIPVEPGDRIAASSFAAKGENLSAINNGIRVTYLMGDQIENSIGAADVYKEYSTYGYITVPAGVDTVCVPWWQSSENNWLNLSQVSKDYAIHRAVDGDAKEPTCTESGYTAGLVCEVCGAAVGEQEEIPATGHSYVDGVCTECGDKKPDSPYLQKLPDNIIGCTNLYTALNPTKGYYSAEKYDTSNGNVLSVVIPVESGDRIAANSFGSVSENLGGVNGIRVTYLLGDQIVSSLGAADVYKEYSTYGYITVPAGVDTVCVPWWQPGESNWLNLSQVSKNYEVHRAVDGEAKEPTCTESGYTAGSICEVCGAAVGEQEKIPAKGHSYVNGTCSVCGQIASPYLQELPENIIGCTNLYKELTPKDGYYTATAYLASYDQVVSVVIPVEPGDRIAASSFAAKGDNLNGSVDGIRVTYLKGNKIVSSLGAPEVYKEYSTYGYITVPEGVDTVCVPWWQPSESNWLNLSQVSKNYAIHRAIVAEAKEPTCTESGYTAGLVCEVCGVAMGEREEIPATGHSYENGGCTICGTPDLAVILKGKYVSVLGDSISTFNGYSNNGSVNSTIANNGPRYDQGTADTKPGAYCLLESVDDTWWMHFANRTEMNLLVNNSWAGSQVFGGKTSDGRVIPAAYLERCVNLHDDTLADNPDSAPIYPDVIFVYLGINDYNFNRTNVGSGTVDYTALVNNDGTYAEPATFGEAYAIMLHKMQKAYPNAQIFAMTLLPENLYSVDKTSWEQHNAYIRAAAEYYDIPVVDLAKNCAITWDNYSGYMMDKIHPTTAGMELISDCIESELQTYYKANSPHTHIYENGICTVCGKAHPNLANYNGKVISIMGDSISTMEDYIPVADGFNQKHRARYVLTAKSDTSLLVMDPNETWWMQTIKALGAKLGINDSWAGSRVNNTSDNNSGDLGPDAAMASLTRIQNLGANGTPDVILVFGGTNDRGQTLGSFDATSAPTVENVDLTSYKWDTFVDAYATMITRMKHYYPNAKIVALLLYAPNGDKLNEQIIKICDHYGVPYADLWDLGIMSNLADSLHPDETGMDLISEQLVSDMLLKVEIEAGEHTVHSVKHTLTDVKASLGHWKGIDANAKFEETLTFDEDADVTVTMNGEDITATAYNAETDVISIESVTGAVAITATAKEAPEAEKTFADRIQQLKEPVYCDTNLWTTLTPDSDHYSANKVWEGPYSSITFPVTLGEQLWATSFGEKSVNGNGSTSGIRVTWFDAQYNVLNSVGPADVYKEFSNSGYLTVPEGAAYVNVPAWVNTDHVVKIISRPTIYDDYLIEDMPEEICAGANIWTLLKSGWETKYMTGSNVWDTNSAAPNLRSITIPINEGDVIYSSAFGEAGTNGNATQSGIRITWFSETGILRSDYISAERGNLGDDGTVTAPAGAVAVNLPVWDYQVENEMYILNLEHKHNAGELKTPATCVNEGLMVYVCSACQETKKETLPIDASAHSYGETEYIWSDDHSTCDAERSCEREGCENSETARATVTSATTPATCTLTGKTVYTAKFDVEWAEEKTHEETLSMISHSYGEDWVSDGTNHWRECACSAKSEAEVHSDETTKDHKCDTCGYKMSECADNDNDHKCDICGKELSACADSDTNHKCDVCGANMGTHEAAEGKHTCDYCGQTVTTCAKSEKTTTYTRVNGTETHTITVTCDVCGHQIGEVNTVACVDDNTDGKCDQCKGEMVVDEIIYGDANGDGSITSKDATYVLQYVVGTVTVIDKTVADVNGDGNVTSKDATEILRFVVGSITEFTVQSKQ